MCSPEIRPEVGKIMIPGKPEEVGLDRVYGDIDSGIRFELAGTESHIDSLPRSD
jgi:hypothetical protein